LDKVVAAVAGVGSLAGLAILGILLLTDSGDEPATPPAAAPLATVVQSILTEREERQTETAATSAATAAAAADAVTEWLQSYQSEPWYGAVQQITVDGRVVGIHTNLSDDDAGRESAISICGTVSEFVYGRDGQPYQVSAIDVYGEGDELLVSREIVVTRCD
jgi:hypothetical protein